MITACLVREEGILAEVVRVVNLESVGESFKRYLVGKMDRASGWVAHENERRHGKDDSLVSDFCKWMDDGAIH